MKRLILINAVIWATLILVASWLFKDVPGYFYFFLLLCVFATITNSLMYTYASKEQKSDCRKILR